MPDTPMISEGVGKTTTPDTLVLPPPTPHLLDFPATTAVVVATLACVVLLVFSTRFDQTHGILTVSLLVILTMIGVIAFCLLSPFPGTRRRAAVIGGLVTAFGGVVAYWLGKPRGDA